MYCDVSVLLQNAHFTLSLYLYGYTCWILKKLYINLIVFNIFQCSVHFCSFFSISDWLVLFPLLTNLVISGNVSYIWEMIYQFMKTTLTSRQIKLLPFTSWSHIPAVIQLAWIKWYHYQWCHWSKWRINSIIWQFNHLFSYHFYGLSVWKHIWCLWKVFHNPTVEGSMFLQKPEHFGEEVT